MEWNHCIYSPIVRAKDLINFSMQNKRKTILISGAGSGIGKDTAFALCRRGHTVIATTETDAQAEILSTESTSQGLSLTILKLDITDEQDRNLLLAHNIDVLINNAGVGQTGPLAEVPMERIRQNFEVNVFGTIALTQIALRQMIQKGNGTVLVVSSIAGRLPLAFLNPYSMTKFALSGGMAALRSEVHAVAPYVHVSLIEPGTYATGFNQRMFATKYEWLDERSLFFTQISSLQKNEARFARFEEKNTRSIVHKIVSAVEAKKPRLRYVAPGYQGLGTYILRLMGM
jgi:short-subunit dehydrogenase